MRARIYCDDKYEAQKLASLIFVKDSAETNIASILNTVKDEIVIELKDKSAHSILLRDESNVEVFADFVQSVLEGNHKIQQAITSGTMVEIIKA